MKKYGVIVFKSGSISAVMQSLQLDFKLTHCQTFESLLVHASFHRDHLVLIDTQEHVESQFDALKRIKQENAELFSELSVALIIEDLSLDKRLKACELGADDCISHLVEHDDLVSRVQNTIFNAIANKQLKDNLHVVSSYAMTAMSKADDLSINIRFFIESFHCENLDHLGQLLFKTLTYYGLNCSLQMRSKFYVKNMEANGMERTMESKLLAGMKDCGSLYEFGCRSVVNEGAVSLLIKNMPEEEPQKKTIIYETVLTLLKAVNQRIELLDLKLLNIGEQEKRIDLSNGFNAELKKIDSKRKESINEVTGAWDALLLSMAAAMHELSLSDKQESMLLELLKQGRHNMTTILQGMLFDGGGDKES